MILLRLPISYQLVIVININVDINYQNRLLSISMRYQLSEHSLINFNINIAIFAYQYFLINALSSSDRHNRIYNRVRHNKSLIWIFPFPKKALNHISNFEHWVGTY